MGESLKGQTMINLDLLSVACSVLSLFVSGLALFKVSNVTRENTGQIQNVSGTDNSVVGRDQKVGP